VIEGVGIEKAYAIYKFDYSEADAVAACMLEFNKKETVATTNALEGMTICITGSVSKFKNRAELQEFIVANGGKATGSVSRNTTVLINNDVTSTSSKNLAAQKLNIPILTEEEFLQKYF
jgi:DNA ligase (NAD+)